MATEKFQPLESLSFERLNSQKGYIEQTPALSKVWIEDVDFLPYLPPNLGEKGAGGEGYESKAAAGGADPLWLEALEMIDGDLHWLLQQPHHKFWCQVMYDTSLHQFLDSYLRSAPRSHDATSVAQLPLKARELMRNIHRRVFMTYLRMSTHKESNEHFISPDVHGGIVYDRFLFDLPKLLDLCVLYGEGNKPLLAKMVANLFERQPKYVEDWCATIKSLSLILDKVSEKVLNKRSGEVLRLDEAKPMTSLDLQEVVLYLSDLAVTLKCFVDVYPPCTKQLASSGWMEKLVSFYGSVIPALQEQWHRDKSEIDNCQHVKTCFRSLKHDLAWLVNAFLYHAFIDKLDYERQGSEGTEEDHHGNVDAFITTVTTILSEKVFLKEFEKHFSLKDAITEMQQAHPEIPEANFDYILTALGYSPNKMSTMESSSFFGTSAAAATETERDQGVVQSLVSQVKEVLSHLGEGFIRACLVHFDYSPEAVINNVLQDNLPPHIRELDQSLGILPSGGRDSLPMEALTGHSGGPLSGHPHVEGESLLDQRSNVYDNDEFDVFRRKNVDRSRVHIGKKYDPTTVSSLLDDKSHLSSTRHKYKAFEVETPWSYISEDQAAQLQTEGGVADIRMGNQIFDPYNDEYDDTYDSLNVGAADNDSADEMITVKRLNQKGLFRRNWTEDASDEEDNENQTKDDVSPLSGLGYRGPSHNQPVSGTFSLLKRPGRPESSVRSSSAVTKNVKKAAAESDRIEPFVKGRKPHGKDRYHPPMASDESKESRRRGEGGRGGGGRAEVDGERREGGERREEGARGKEGGGVIEGRVSGGKGGGGGKSGEQRFHQSKERHKGSRANHNRRALADRKRDRGMAGAPSRF